MILIENIQINVEEEERISQQLTTISQNPFQFKKLPFFL